MDFLIKLRKCTTRNARLWMFFEPWIIRQRRNPPNSCIYTARFKRIHHLDCKQTLFQQYLKPRKWHQRHWKVSSSFPDLVEIYMNLFKYYLWLTSIHLFPFISWPIKIKERSHNRGELRSLNRSPAKKAWYFEFDFLTQMKSVKSLSIFKVRIEPKFKSFVGHWIEIWIIVRKSKNSELFVNDLKLGSQKLGFRKLHSFEYYAFKMVKSSSFKIVSQRGRFHSYISKAIVMMKHGWQSQNFQSNWGQCMQLQCAFASYSRYHVLFSKSFTFICISFNVSLHNH